MKRNSSFPTQKQAIITAITEIQSIIVAKYCSFRIGVQNHQSLEDIIHAIRTKFFWFQAPKLEHIKFNEIYLE